MRDLEGDLEGNLERDLEGDLEEDLEEDLEGDFKGDLRGDFEQDMEADLLSSLGQVRSRSGLVQIWFSLQLKCNYFELDSEVGRLVCTSVGFNTWMLKRECKFSFETLQQCLVCSEQHRHFRTSSTYF